MNRLIATVATVNESDAKHHSSVHTNANEDNNQYNFVSMPIKNSLNVFQLHTLVFQLVNDSFTVLYTSMKWIIKPIYLCFYTFLFLSLPLSLSIYLCCLYIAIGCIDIGLINLSMCVCACVYLCARNRIITTRIPISSRLFACL